ncbi:helix-turn-helix domain-containing protein [Lacrimispora sp.]|uniref:helix-turn-helix domain-containing protein n=1 Tax=Lacrimispora sp. TaxID=2719234 RepID=UPI002898A29A|nr:AraC family transcriptional regulator [Lacrimispora sp.]
MSLFDKEILMDQSEDFVTYKLRLSEGTGTVQVYQVFQGIEIAKVNISSNRYMPEISKSRRIIEINHCQAGRFECRMDDGCFQYVGEGDIFLSPLKNHCNGFELPLGYYQGLVITIDLDSAPVQWDSVIPGMPSDICRTFERFFLYDECFLIQSRDEIKHIFSGMYFVPEKVRGAYYRIKIMELLLYLFCFDPAGEKRKHIYARQQVDIVKQIHKRITEEFSYRFTIEELAREYCISATALKQHFKGIYGQSIAIYMKEFRIQKASQLLRDTEQSIADISTSVGYESQSKFTAAFKDIMNITPLEYRKSHRIN